MKKILLFLVLIVSLVACNKATEVDKTKVENETQENETQENGDKTGAEDSNNESIALEKPRVQVTYMKAILKSEDKTSDLAIIADLEDKIIVRAKMNIYVISKENQEILQEINYYTLIQAYPDLKEIMETSSLDTIVPKYDADTESVYIFLNSKISTWQWEVKTGNLYQVAKDISTLRVIPPLGELKIEGEGKLKDVVYVHEATVFNVFTNLPQ